MRSVMTPLYRLVHEAIDGRSMAVVRVGAGCAVIGEGIAQWHVLTAMLQPQMLAMPILGVPRLPLDGVPVFIGVWMACAAAFVAGWRVRVTGPLLAALLGYTLVLDEQTYSNHLYLMVLVVGLVTCAGGGGSRTIPAWPAILLKSQLSIVYAFAAVSKLNAAYLSGIVFYVTVKPEVWAFVPVAMRAPQIMTALALGTIALELFLAFALWSPYWRRRAVVLGVAFHALLAVVIQVPYFALLVFGALMVSLYALFQDMGPALVYQRVERTRRRFRQQLTSMSSLPPSRRFVIRH